MTHPLEGTAHRLFTAAIREARCGELLACLWADGTATIDPDGHLVLISGNLIQEVIKESR